MRAPDHCRDKTVITKKETFGPVAPLYRFKNEDEPIEMANDTEFGLAACYSRDIGRIWRGAPSSARSSFAVSHSGAARKHRAGAIVLTPARWLP